jgi:hypothetical protein
MDFTYSGMNRETGLADCTGGAAVRPNANARELRLRSRALWPAIVLALLFVPAAKAQLPDQGPTQPLSENAGQISGNYSFQQSVEFGYRDSMISGNMNNYNTFENLGSGVRLFNYTLDMKSQNHKGLFFDNLSFSNFGYGGDPNSVSRLHVDKNKWYDFRAMFRRDEYFFDYDLLANPLNPSTFPSTCGTTVACTPVAITNSPHALYYDRHMQDYDLTLLPESRVRFRLGYSRIFTGGPGDTTLEGGADTVLSQSTASTADAYRMGVDYKGIARTTFSFDELLNYEKIDQTATDTNTRYQLSNGTPVDLGIVFQGTSPCATPVTNATTTPPTVTANCNGYLSYNKVQNPRSSFPTERFSFESSYFKNLEMNGAVAYSGDRNSIPDFDEIVNGWTSRTATRESTTAGPASASRVEVNADWAADYRITDKLHIIDEFRFDNWRIPGMWETAETNLYATPATSGQTGLLLPIAEVTPADFATLCPTAPYNGPNCPQHAAPSGSSPSGSSADVVNELVSQFLGQNLKSNIFELHYDFTSRISARLGYEYTSRAISDFSATWDTGEIYFPGGPGGTAANYYNAARGDCALVSGTLPTTCAVNSNGSIQEGTPTNLVPEAGNDTARNFYDIHENLALLGITIRPTSTLRINADLEAGSNDNSFTRISPRELQDYKVHGTYTPKPWASVSGAVDIHENRDDVYTVDNIEHGRAYSFNTTLAPSPQLWIDFGYNYMDIYTQTEICFAASGTGVPTYPACPPSLGSPVAQSTLSYYESKDYYAYGDVMWKPYKRVTATFGYLGSIVRGNTTFLNPLSPTGTLDFNYVKPYVSLTVDLYKGFSYKTAWNYYGYNDHGVANPTGLAALPLQNFDGSNVTFSFLCSF